MTTDWQSTYEAAMPRIARPSGAFAMVAMDQRDSLRAMFAERVSGPIPVERRVFLAEPLDDLGRRNPSRSGSHGGFGRSGLIVHSGIPVCAGGIVRELRRHAISRKADDGPRA